MIPHLTPERSSPTVAVIGSGPSGCYAAHFLSKGVPEARICIFESLPVPYGLVRYGVAADHQGIKAVAQQFDRIFERGHATFVGNVRVGHDVSFEAVARAFDVVVIATGMPEDRRLPIPQDDSARVVGAGQLLRALNGFPARLGQHGAPLGGAIAPLGRDIVVVGHGNVAMDTVRLLTKRPEELVGSDIDDRALELLRPEPLRSVRLMGRSSVGDAKFDLAMIRELCQVQGAKIRTENLHDSDRGAVADLLREFGQENGIPAPLAHGGTSAGDRFRTEVTIHFEAIPVRIRHADQMTSLDVRCRRSGAVRSFSADTVITAIGFCQDSDQRAGTPDATWSGAHVYRVGWVENGAQGNLAENRKHAQSVARKILDDFARGRIVPGREPGLPALLPDLKAAPTSFSAWRVIDEFERKQTAPGRCRRKMTDLVEMVALAQASMANT
ncbi:FAD-dependent oxidoreductase [Streptomyces sp. NPDC051322]|uniref:FAD-dependent oxidoreductase n=1 Tax=Streptomyces sp. NPDC051322 TaxID=3154645 RepID=UPI00344DF906